MLLNEFALDAGQLAQLDEVRILGVQSTECPAVGTQGVGGDKGVPAIVLGAGDGVAIAEAV
jgi:hypothetical protein